MKNAVVIVVFALAIIAGLGLFCLLAFQPVEACSFQDFLENDTTEKHTWNKHYQCGGFAEDFTNNATKAGFKVNIAYLSMKSQDHIVVAVHTNDTMFFLEPQNDQVIEKPKNQGYITWKLGEYLLHTTSGSYLQNIFKYGVF